MQFRVLGPVEAHDTRGAPVDLSARKRCALLAALLLNANAWVGVDELIDAIWHEQAVPASAVPNLRNYVCQLRRSLGDRLAGQPGAYRITVLADELDTDRVQALVEAARTALSARAYAEAAEHAAAALALWRGTPYDGFGFGKARSAAARLDETHRELSGLLAEAYLALGRLADATAQLRALTERHPLWEGGWVRLMHAYRQEGRYAEALAAYDRAHTAISGTLAVQPGPELAAARREILVSRVRGQAPQHRGDASHLTVVDNGTPGPVPTPIGRAGVDALLASARTEVLVMSAGGGQLVGSFRRMDLENLRRGMRYRVLFPDSARLSGALNNLSLAGAEVRTDVEVPTDAMVIDEQTVVLPADRSGAMVFRLPGVVTATVGLFERIWPGAAPLIPSDPAEAGDTPGLTRRERDLLALLCSGWTDESAGARLGISVRTVRRMVADLMNRLGARSRFQAGLKIADRGWLLEQAG